MLCVILKIDEKSTAALQELQAAAVRYGASPKEIHGHITLVSYLGANEAVFLAYCRHILRNVEPFCVEYEGLSQLDATNIIAAVPAKSDALCSLHNRLGCGHWESLDRWSQEDVWTPHTTLVYDPELDLGQLCSMLQTHFKPFTARITGVEFSRVTADGYEIVDCVDLKSVKNQETSNGNKARRHDPAGLPEIRH